MCSHLTPGNVRVCPMKPLYVMIRVNFKIKAKIVD